MKQMAMILLATVLGTGALSGQSGYFSEIKMSFTNQTALLPASPILTPGAQRTAANFLFYAI
jgi:hypothetical protein